MQLEIIRMIQRFSNPVLDVVMEGFTLCGEQMILATVFCVIYWSVNKRLGQYLAITLGVSVCLNGAVKDIFKVERIFNKDGIVSRRVETATGYSFPSGHTQTSTAFWGGTALYIKKTPARVCLAALTLLIGFSRIYLGVHYPTDVLGGLFFGIACAILLYNTMIAHENRGITLIICLAIMAFAIIVRESEDTIKAVGMMAGILSGILFEERFVSFTIPPMPFFKRFFRCFTGMAAVGACYFLTNLLLPDIVILSAARYALVVFTALGLSPFIFTKLGL